MKQYEKHDDIQYAVKGCGTILVVDDDVVLRSLTSCILKKDGYTVITAENGIDGISKFMMLPAEINGVVLDLNMPLKNGYETLAELLELKPGLKILITSGESSPESINRLKDSGAFGFMGKPFSVSELSERVKDMVAVSGE